MKTTMVVAFGQVHANALAKKLDLQCWQLITSVAPIDAFTPASHDLVFCETARHLAAYDEIVEAATRSGWHVPDSLHDWGHHSATLSGAFKLLEDLQGIEGLCNYRIFSKGYGLGVYLKGELVMHKRDDGALRFATKGGSL